MLFLHLAFLFVNVKCLESASQNNITNVMSIQLHVDIDIKNILNLLLLEIMIIEST